MALANNHVHAAYQKIVDLQSEEVVAEETLAKIVNGDEVLEAYQFIEAASQLQLVPLRYLPQGDGTVARSRPSTSDQDFCS